MPGCSLRFSHNWPALSFFLVSWSRMGADQHWTLWIHVDLAQEDWWSSGQYFRTSGQYFRSYNPRRWAIVRPKSLLTHTLRFFFPLLFIHLFIYLFICLFVCALIATIMVHATPISDNFKKKMRNLIITRVQRAPRVFFSSSLKSLMTFMCIDCSICVVVSHKFPFHSSD